MYIAGRLEAATQSPTARNWQALKATIRFLIGTSEKGIVYTAGQCRRPTVGLFKCYVDDSFAGDKKDLKYMTGIYVTYNGASVAWKSGKQNMVGLSTAKDEYIALATAVKKIRIIK